MAGGTVTVASADFLFLNELEGALPSHTKLHYPCWLIPVSKLRTLDRLPQHEDALSSNLLDELTATSTQPSCAFSFFVSQCVTP